MSNYSFSELPEAARKSLLQFDLIEKEQQGLSTSNIEEFYSKKYPNGICYKEVPREEFLTWLWDKFEPIRYFKTWDEYEQDFRETTSRLKNHPSENRYAVLVSERYEDVIVDGWNRMVSYCSNKHDTIPVITYNF